MGFLSKITGAVKDVGKGIGKGVGDFYSGLYKTGADFWKMGKDAVKNYGSTFSQLAGVGIDGVSSAAQIALAEKGYDKALQGIQEQNATAKQIADQANFAEIYNAGQYNASTRQIAQEANQVSSAEALKNRQFQMLMSGTAHTREVADLRQAGLNPILSGTGGMGSSTPSGAQGTAHQAPQTKPSVHRAPVYNEGAAVSTAMDVLRSMASAMKANSEATFIREAKTTQTRAETARTRSETMPRHDNVARLKAQVRNISADTHRTLMDADLKDQMRQESKAIVQNLEKTGKNLSVQNRQMLAQLKQMLADEQVYNGEAGYWIRLIEKLAPAAGKLPNPIQLPNPIRRR